MSEARIGRVLVASLHQAIGDVLPTRQAFYEHWLHSDGLRRGGIGVAPMLAVLGFLRVEGTAYGPIVTRAGRYAADWHVDALSGITRRLIGALPVPLRARAALRVGRRLVKRADPRSRAACALRRGLARVDLRGSLFCDVRERSQTPLCGFYAAAFVRVLERFALAADAEVSVCRATGADRCTLTMTIRSPDSGSEVSVP